MARFTIEYEGDKGDKSDVYAANGKGEKFSEILARRINRRGLMKGAAASGALVLTAKGLNGVAAQDATPGATPAATPGATPSATPAATNLNFEAIVLDTGPDHLVAAGYAAAALLKWGDPIFADAPEFDPAAQTAASQAMQFGYNCDWIGFMPLPQGSTTSDHGLLVVNHEYTNPELMFPGYIIPNPDYVAPSSPDEPSETPEFIAVTSQDIVDVELEAHGLSVVEIIRDGDGVWQVVRDSEYNRRITATTPTEVTGPAAGSDWMKTIADPTGLAVMGTLNNCAGGTTPWGTAISGEENFQQYFANLSLLAEDDPNFIDGDRFGINEEASDRQWELFHDRFDLSKEPNEPYRFGWAVEFDPYDPTSTPKKRTALGRNKHEGHTSFVSPVTGQVAIYSGDDERFESAYKFVTAGAYNPDDRAANMDLLDDGILYVAKYNDDGTGEWLPLVFGEGPLTEANGFVSQADVVTRARFAADALGATKMDRPEDFETNPVTGKVYLVCTNNSRRTLEETNKANPRPENYTGHIIEMTETGGDHAATTFEWAMFILAGDPNYGGTYYGGYDTGLVSPFASPDNIAFDTAGNLWISTDGMPNSLPGNDGLFATPTEGEERGYTKQFFSSVPGAEVSGPIFNPDDTALFAAVQHPGEGGTYDAPISQWPTGDGPPRPSVVVITTDGGVARIGSGVS
ncbi:MAG: PhoX family phosphatase [Chloroflexia bacterium]|nr:PhoX family phosphatase [Chloroflexia bacterium]